jgi:hypothetical protein
VLVPFVLHNQLHPRQQGDCAASHSCGFRSLLARTFWRTSGLTFFFCFLLFLLLTRSPQSDHSRWWMFLLSYFVFGAGDAFLMVSIYATLSTFR